MELLNPPDIAPAPVTIDWSRPVIDLNALEWPFDDDSVNLNIGVCYIDSRGRLNGGIGSVKGRFVLTLSGDETILGHLTDGRMFVSSREGVDKFMTGQS